MLGFLAFVLLFDKEEESINVPFLAVGFFMNIYVFFLLPGLYSLSFTTIHGFGPSIRSNFVLPVLRFCN